MDGSWGGWVRTTNLPVNSRLLCQLSYTPLWDRKNMDWEAGGAQRSLSADSPVAKNCSLKNIRGLEVIPQSPCHPFRSSNRRAYASACEPMTVC